VIKRNDGIVVTGGSFSSHNVAVGNKARVAGDAGHQQLTAAQLEEILALLGQISTTLNTDPARPEAERLRAASSRLATEIARPSPRSNRMATFMKEIEAASKSVSSVASGVEAVKALIGVFT
jgi:hypothetical protein